MRVGEGTGGEKQREERKERETKKEKKGKEKDRKKIRRLLPLIYRHSDDQSSSGRELKSVYLMRATLQEVENFPTLSYFHPKGCLAVFSALRGCLAEFFIGLPYVDPILYL